MKKYTQNIVVSFALTMFVFDLLQIIAFVFFPTSQLAKLIQSFIQSI